MDGNALLFELIQVGLGNRLALSTVPTAEEWKMLLSMSRKQAVTGICYVAMQRLPQGQWPDIMTVRQWAMMASVLPTRNAKATQECLETVDVLTKAGLDHCILKGQSLHDCYPEEMRQYRTPGDVDVWVKPFGKDGTASEARALTKAERMRIIEFAWDVSGDKELPVYHHIHCERLLPDNLVELHFTPSFSINPFDNRRLQRLFDSHWNDRERCSYGFMAMPKGLNLVFMLSHISRHVVTEGIGLRQLLDYYMVLKSFCDDEAAHRLNGDLSSRTAVMGAIRKVGMKGICSAVMYVMQQVFGMDDCLLLCKPNDKLGKELLQDIIDGGNFGREHERVKGIYDGKNNAVRFFRSLKSSMRLFRSYPREIIWVPYSNLITSINKNYWRHKGCK